MIERVPTKIGSSVDNNEDNLHRPLQMCRFSDVIVTVKCPAFMATDIVPYRTLRSRFNCHTDIVREIGWNIADINTHDDAGV